MCNLSWTSHSSLEKDNSLNLSCVSPRMGLLVYTTTNNPTSSSGRNKHHSAYRLPKTAVVGNNSSVKRWWPMIIHNVLQAAVTRNATSNMYMIDIKVLSECFAVTCCSICLCGNSMANIISRYFLYI